MISIKRDHILVNYDEWALADSVREISAGFPLIKDIKGSIVSAYLTPIDARSQYEINSVMKLETALVAGELVDLVEKHAIRFFEPQGDKASPPIHDNI